MEKPEIKRSSFLERTRNLKENSGWLAMCYAVALQVRAYLRKNGLSQEWLAKEMGVSGPQISKMFAGENITLESIDKMAKVIGFIPVLDVNQIPRERQTFPKEGLETAIPPLENSVLLDEFIREIASGKAFNEVSEIARMKLSIDITAQHHFISSEYAQEETEYAD